MTSGQITRSDTRTSLLNRVLAMVLTALICLALPIEIVSAAPAPIEPNNPIAMEDIGNGWYRITASVFAEGTDGAVGTMASSGRIIQPNDNLVSLPGCTESSCPWVPVGTGVDGTYGPQTTCAESDGLCWVEIVSVETGLCTVAPVHDRGPFFIRDNYWAPRSLRKYDLPQGEPAAEYIARGGDLGFGPGISDSGYDVQHIWTYAAGIDIAGGTWKALGLPTAAGITPVEVRMLWQVGLTHDQACGNEPAPTPPTPIPPSNDVLATVIDGALNLRASASTNAQILTVMPDGAQVTLTGRSQNGFLSVTFDGQQGWAFADFLMTEDETPTTGTATVIDGALNLRSAASLSASVLAVMPNGANVQLTGESSNGFSKVVWNGTTGWAYSIYLATDETPGDGTFATVFDGALNLRAGAGTNYDILTVMPDGARVELTGSTANGFSQVVYRGMTGWASNQWLAHDPVSSTAIVFDGALNLRSGPSTDDSVLVVMPDGARVTLLGSSSNGFAKVRYNGTEGWAYSIYLDREA